MHFEMRLQRYRELVEHAEDVHHEDHQSKVSQLIVDTRTQVGVVEISQVCNSTFYSCELMGTGGKWDSCPHYLSMDPNLFESFNQVRLTMINSFHYYTLNNPNNL